MEMQSSPVLMAVLRMVTDDDNWTWMPSVLGLFPGALTLTPAMCTFLQPLMTMWYSWLFNEVIPLITMFSEFVKRSVCTHRKIKQLTVNNDIYMDDLLGYLYYGL